MQSRYSFEGLSVLNIQRLINSIIPGLDRILTVYYCNEIKAVKAVAFNEHQKTNQEEVSISDISFFNELRKKHTPFSWHLKEELPFYIQKSGKKQIDMFALDDVVLLLRLYNEHDGLFDLFFLYFKENTNYLGLRKDNSGLNQESKMVIGNLLYNTLNAVTRKDKKDRNFMIENRKVVESVLKRFKSQKKKYDNVLMRYELSLVSLFEKYLHEFSLERGKDFTLSEGAIKEIKNFAGDISHIKQIAEKAVDEAEILNNQDDLDQIVIDECYLDLDAISKAESDRIISIDKSEDKYYKTRALLNKLEAAIVKLKQQNINITGSNVGKACAVPISAPAISDALKKHSNKIQKLMNNEPGNWPLLRQDFRPLQNILTRRSAMGA